MVDILLFVFRVVCVVLKLFCNCNRFVIVIGGGGGEVYKISKIVRLGEGVGLGRTCEAM